MIHIRYCARPGSQLAFSIERLSDDFYYDFDAKVFSSSTAVLRPMMEDVPPCAGSWKVDFQTPPTVFGDMDYAIRIHDAAQNNVVVCIMGTALRGGSDATFMGGPVASVTGDVGGRVVGNGSTDFVGNGVQVSSPNPSAPVNANVTQWAGSTVPAPVLTGMPRVDVRFLNGKPLM